MATADDSAMKDVLARYLDGAKLDEAVDAMRAHVAERTAKDAGIGALQSALATSEARCRAVFDDNPLPMWVYDLATRRIIEANHAAARTYGYSVDEFRELTVPDLWFPEDRERVLALTTKPPENSIVIARQRKKDGTGFWVESYGSAFPAVGINARVAVIKDITSERAAEVARRRAETRFARLRDTGVVGIVITSMQWQVIDVNEAFSAMVGYSHDELVSGKVSWRSLTPPEWNDVDAKAIEQLRVGGAAGLREKEYVRKDGSRCPVLIATAVVEGIETISFVIDLSERKRMDAIHDQLRRDRETEERRRQVDERFRLLVESVQDYAILVLSPEGIVASWGMGAERIKGYSASEIVGQHFGRFFLPEDAAAGRPLRALALARRDGRYEEEGWRLRKDGSRFWAHATLTAVREKSGELLGFTKVTHDVTERREREEALRTTNAALEASTAQLRAVNSELEAFSYSLAHDLRAPLRAMHGYAQIVVEDFSASLDAEAKSYLDRIMQNAVKMGALTDAMLALARLTKSEMHPEPVDLSEIAQGVADQLSLGDPTRACTFVIREGLRAKVDRALARALYENLLGNAWKFTSKTAAPRIEVGTVDDEHGAPAFFVRDNGAGFDMAYAKKLFVAFQRLHTEREFAGTGVGLASVERIVERHGGRIWAEGAVDRGATFYFTLPV